MKRMGDWSTGQLFMILGVWAAVGIAYMAAGTADYAEEVNQAELYCDMVQLYKDTAGREGWPDYKSTYIESCDN